MLRHAEEAICLLMILCGCVLPTPYLCSELPLGKSISHQANKEKPSLDSILCWVGTVEYDCNKIKGLQLCLSVRENFLWSVRKWFQILREIRSLNRGGGKKKKGCLEGKMISLMRLRKLWRSCEIWPFARGIAENKIWESRDNNWVWNSIDKSFLQFCALFLSIRTAVLPDRHPLALYSPYLRS